MKQKEEFFERIKAAFKIEAEEILEKMTASLLDWESIDSPLQHQELLDIVYRQAHTLKGASRAVDMLDVEIICQEQESVFSILKEGKAQLSAEGVDLLLRSTDVIKKILAREIDNDSTITYNVPSMVIKLKKLYSQMVHGSENIQDKPEDKKEIKPANAASPDADHSALPKVPLQQIDQNDSWKQDDKETIRVSTQKLDRLLMQLEEMLSVKLTTIQMKKQLEAMLKHFVSWKTGASEILPSVKLLRQINRNDIGENCSKLRFQALHKVLKFLHWGNSLASKTESELFQMLKFWDRESNVINVQVDSLLRDTKKIMMVPFAEILQLFPKVVRDLSREQGKSVKLIIRGESIEIDRRILEKLKNPLIHLLRNSIDHGIEKPSQRKRKNKEITGVIRINLERSEKNRIRFTIEDDGAGINLKKLKLAVQAQNAAQNLDLEAEDKLIEFIYKSGISTSDSVTEISGRGLGLAIMKSSINDLEGTIEVITQKDIGTKFVIELPVSLVTFRGIIVHAGKGEYVMPTTRIDKILLIDIDEVKTVENKSIIYYENELVPLAALVNILNVNNLHSDSQKILVMLIHDEGRQIAVKIDGLEEEQEILVKNFNSHLKRIRNIAGATVLGSGKVVPILNPQDMVNSIFKNIDMIEKTAQKKELENNRKSKILIVEDSVTSRMLMKNILENSGYIVETAFDGIDGLTKVRETKYDLVISDVDMPRMNGFDMTASIRADASVKQMPVIMVTSLHKSEDQKRGKEVGANDYIIKSNFAQSNLEDVIEKLLDKGSID